MIEVKKHTDGSINAIYQSYISVYGNELRYDIVLQFYGEFSVSLIRRIASAIEQDMTERGDQKTLVKRMFSILTKDFKTYTYMEGKEKMEIRLHF